MQYTEGHVDTGVNNYANNVNLGVSEGHEMSKSESQSQSSSSGLFGVVSTTDGIEKDDNNINSNQNPIGLQSNSTISQKQDSGQTIAQVHVVKTTTKNQSRR